MELGGSRVDVRTLGQRGWAWQQTGVPAGCNLSRAAHLSRKAASVYARNSLSCDLHPGDGSGTSQL